MNSDYRITIIIPHYNGRKILSDCLLSIRQNTFKSYTTIVIDNGSTDGSQEMVRQEFPEVRLLENETNLGYSGACNQGMKLSQTDFILLLNNDTVMPPNFLEEMFRVISANEKIAAVQPKILSIQDKQFFDYSGGAGGEMDILGYPFARGRIFDMVEKDKGQYDALSSRVFWTSGCAMLLRHSVLKTVGYLDEDFFAHQEEIDLNWRLQLAGYENHVALSTYIYHYSGFTLRSHNQYKMYLNHRNNLIMMLKNYSALNLLILFPPRLLLELAAIVADTILWDGKRAKAVMKALFFISTHPLFILRKRFQVQKLRQVSDRAIWQNMYRSSVVIDHFVRRMKPLQCIRRFRRKSS